MSGFPSLRSGGSFVQRRVIIPDVSPFADIAALATWANANLDLLRNSEGEDPAVTVVVVTNNAGMPDTTTNTYEWGGDDQPVVYDVTRWLIYRGLNAQEVKDLLESNPNTNTVTNVQEEFLNKTLIVEGDSFLDGSPRATSLGFSNTTRLYENAGELGILQPLRGGVGSRYSVAMYETNRLAAGGKLERFSSTGRDVTRVIAAPAVPPLTLDITNRDYDITNVQGLVSLFSLTYQAIDAVTNLKIRIVDVVENRAVFYWPNYAQWHTGQGTDHAANSPMVLDFFDAPAKLGSDVDYRVEMRASSGTVQSSILLTTDPAQEWRVQPAKYVASQDQLEHVDIAPAQSPFQSSVNQSLRIDLGSPVVILMPLSPEIGDILRIRELFNISDTLTIKNGAVGLIGVKNIDGTVTTDNEVITSKSEFFDIEFTSNGWVINNL